MNLIHRLQEIAKLNDDEFSYNIEINPHTKKLGFTLVVNETQENHTFLIIKLENLDKLEEIDENMIKECCENWGYKYG